MSTDLSAAAIVEKEITDTFALLAILLVFVFAFFSALLTQSSGVIAANLTDETPQRDDVRRKSQLYLGGFLGLLILDGAILYILIDVTRRSITVPFDGPNFPTVRAGLWLVDALLVVTLVLCLAMIGLLGGKWRDVNEYAPAANGAE